VPPQGVLADSNFQGIVPDVTALVLAHSSDLCTPQPLLSAFQNPPPGTKVGTGLHPITVTVTDQTGNFAVCTVQFTVNAIPTIEGPLFMPRLIFDEAVAPAGGFATANTAPTIKGLPGISATLDNSLGSESLPIAAFNYQKNPAQNTSFGGEASFVDLALAGATTKNSVTANFYYPSTVTGDAQNNLALFYLGPTGGCNSVLSSGGTIPAKVNTPDLDNTVSGGRFSVTFDATSKPSVTELAGTPFAMAADMTPPTITCPGDVVIATELDECSAHVSFSVSATDNSGTSTVVCNPASGSVFPKGTTTVDCTAIDPAGNPAKCFFKVTVVDKISPVITCPPGVTVQCLRDVPPPTFTGSVIDNCDPSPVVTHVGDVVEGTHPMLIKRTFQATDASANTSTCIQTITVQGLVGDLNGDYCVDQTDLKLLLDRIRAHDSDLTYDINGDGKVDVADARFLVLHFTSRGGTPCRP
jgi:hypothetical protein